MWQKLLCAHSSGTSHPEYSPAQSSIDSMCFVTAVNSGNIYFSLCIQLIESIRATRWYNHVPIKVIDCGLTPHDIEILTNMGCEVKDPGWDVPEEWVHSHFAQKEIMKGISARHCLHKHFPGYQYYFWLDADVWIQSELGLDEYLCIAEKQGMCGSNSLHARSWKSIWNHHLTHDQKIFLRSKNIDSIAGGGGWCLNHQFMEYYYNEVYQMVHQQKQLKWGTDDSMLTYTMHKYIDTPEHSKLATPFAMHEISKLYLGQKGEFIRENGDVIPFISLDSLPKTEHFYHFPFQQGMAVRSHIHSSNTISLFYYQPTERTS